MLTKNLACFCNFQKLPKENDRPIGENSPNLAILSGSQGLIKSQFLLNKLCDYVELLSQSV
jgi:hypothetical protein